MRFILANEIGYDTPMRDKNSVLGQTLVTCGYHKGHSFKTIFYNPVTGQRQVFETPCETHDVVQDPHCDQRFAAFGRRPPVNQSFIFRLDQPGLNHAFAAIPDHSFFGHGFWTQNNILGTSEVSGSGQSKIVLRCGDAPEEVIEIIDSSGYAVHALEYEPATDTILLAHNGDWYSPKRPQTNGPCFELFNLKTRKSRHFYFPELPYTFGLQHFLKIGDEVYCLFRIPPDFPHDPGTTAVPFVKLNLQTGKCKFMPFPSKFLLDEFYSDALSIQVNDHFIVITGQRGSLLCIWERETDAFLYALPFHFPSGVSLNGNTAHVSTRSGLLYEVSLEQRSRKLLDREFFASSHHQAVRIG